jgi:hypothetical protein
MNERDDAELLELLSSEAFWRDGSAARHSYIQITIRVRHARG